MEVPKEVPNETKEEMPQTAQDYMGYDSELFESKDTPAQETTGVTPDVTEVINKTLKDIKVDDKGKFIYPEGISPELKAAIAATKSFRDTQSSYTKTQQELKALKAEAEALKEQVTKSLTPTAGLSEEDRTALDTLKYTNPDEWFKQMKQLETQAANQVEQKFGEVREKAMAKTAEEQRVEILKSFNQGVENPLSAQEIEQYAPPVWQKQVIEGTLPMEEFLEKTYNFIHADKVVKSPEVTTTTNINSLPGAKDVVTKQGIDYANVTF